MLLHCCNTISTDHRTFECIRTKIVASLFTFRIVTVYRPPPSKKNKLKTSEFFEEFNTFLADQILVKGKLIILGDFNFHLDHKNNADTIRFNNLLDTYGLTQLVKEQSYSWCRDYPDWRESHKQCVGIRSYTVRSQSRDVLSGYPTSPFTKKRP